MSYCPNCGTQLAADARFCPNCGTEIGAAAAPPSASKSAASAPPAETQPVATTSEPAYAGLGRRIVAHLIDAVVVFVFYWNIGTSVAKRAGGMTEGGFALEGSAAMLVISLTVLAAMVYFILFEALWNGQTIGKFLLRIHVVDEAGGRCGFGQALVRNLLRIVDGLVVYLVGIILIAWSDRNQRLGDRVAHTIVVRRPRKAPKDKSKSNVRFSMGTRSGADYVD